MQFHLHRAVYHCLGWQSGRHEMSSAQSGEKNQALQKLSEQGWNRGWGWDYLGDKNYLGLSRIRTRLGLGWDWGWDKD